MTPRLSGHFSIFGLVFFVLKSLLGIARQWSREKFAILTPRVMLEFSYIESGLLVGCWCPLTQRIPETNWRFARTVGSSIDAKVSVL